MNDTDIDQLGPVDYLVVEFPAGRERDGSALPLLVDLVDRGIIRILVSRSLVENSTAP